MRKDKPFPKLSSECENVSAFWQAYCDDFDLSELVRESPEFYKELAIPHAWHDLACKQHAAANVPTSADKAGVRESVVVRLGALVDGRFGLIPPSADKFGLLAGLTHFILTRPRVSKRMLQVVCGHWTNAFQFRREGSSYLCRVWSLIAKLPDWASIVLPLPIKREFMSCLILLPLMQIDLRAPIDDILSASDASERGGGVCVSSELTDSGKRAFASELAVPPGLGRDVVGLVSLFDGIGGARRSFDLLGVELAAFAISEISEPACKIVRHVWPEVQEWGDIKQVGKEQIQSFLRSALHLRVIFIAAGSPCQDVSGLNANGKGLLGQSSSLLFEALRVIDLIKELAKGIEVCVLIENVKSMDSHGPESRRAFSRLLNVLPICSCPSNFCDVRRPRYYWVNWPIWSSPQALVEEDP